MVEVVVTILGVIVSVRKGGKMSKDVSQLFLVLTFILVGDLRGRQGHKTAKRGIRVKSFVWDTDHVQMLVLEKVNHYLAGKYNI